MKIGELANASGISTKTVRFYESIGVLPEPERHTNGYRRYGDSTLERVRFITDAQAAGLSLAEIGMILDMKDSGESTCEHVVFLLEEHMDEIDRRIEELGRARSRLKDMVGRARRLDPRSCSDPNRCQTVSTSEHRGKHPFPPAL